MGPGEFIPFHKHWTNILVPLTDISVKDMSPDGMVRMREWKAGEVSFRHGGIEATRNLTDKPIESIVIELKGRSGAPKLLEERN